MCEAKHFNHTRQGVAPARGGKKADARGLHQPQMPTSGGRGRAVTRQCNVGHNVGTRTSFRSDPKGNLPAWARLAIRKSKAGGTALQNIGICQTCAVLPHASSWHEGEERLRRV